MSNTKKYGWGIVGCGRISHDFCNVLLNHKRSKIISCGARSLDKSQSFATKFNIPLQNAYNCYDKVSQNNQVDIVYIGTFHPSHHLTVITALNNKKHVLCEKPVAMNAFQLKQMIKTAKMNKKFFMEGLWTRFFPSFRKARQLITDGAIGEITAFFADYGRVFDGIDKLPRIWTNRLGGGALLDIGCYAINPITWIFGDKYPQKIVANSMIDSRYNVDVQNAISLRFEGNKFSQITTGLITNTLNEYTICGTKGKIIFKSPAHKCTKLVLCKYHDIQINDIVSRMEMECKLPDLKEFKYGFNFARSQGFGYQIDTVFKCLDEGLIECPEYKWNEMMIIMRIIDEVRKQIGLTYPADKYSKL